MQLQPLNQAVNYMKRTLSSLLVIFALLLISHQGRSQATATEGKVEHSNGDKVAAVIELPYPVDEVENVIKDYLAKKGVKGDKSKGFEVYRSAKLKDGDAELNDLHFKVERKSRKEKDITVVYLLVGRPSENVGARTPSDRHKVDEAKSFLNGLAPSAEAYHLEVQINEQMEVVKKADKKMAGLVEDSVSLLDKIKSLQTKLEANRAEQQKQVEEVAKQRSILEAMRNRRKS